MKLKVFNIDEFDAILRGIVKVVEGCKIDLTKKGTTINIGNGKVRAFIKTTCIAVDESEETEETSICFEMVNKLIQAVSFIKETSSETEFILETDGIFLSYKGHAKFKLKLDKPERVEQWTTTPLKTELTDLFSFRITQDQIDFLSKYSTFNPNFEVKAYLYLKDNTLYCDIDDKNEARISSVTVPITKDFEGTLANPVIMDLNDMRIFSLISKTQIKVIVTEKCVKVLSFRKTDNTKTALQMIVRILKN